MPLYEFSCACGERIEKLFVKPVKTTKCPKCGKRMERIISAPNFHLKGTGWAKDNYGCKKVKEKKPKLGDKDNKNK